MKKHFTWMIIAVAIVVVASWAVVAQGLKDPIKVVWEYRSMTAYGGLSDSTLNQYGNDGWELVSVTSGCQGENMCFYSAYFKRRK